MIVSVIVIVSVSVSVRTRHRVAEAAELDVTAELRALALELTGLVRGVARLCM